MRLPSGWLPEGEDFLDNTGREFYTLKGYQLQNGGDITESMEDYLEMICRHIQENGYIRINFLAEQLHVRPSSASKMVGKLREMDLVTFEKYGLIVPTGKGKRRRPLSAVAARRAASLFLPAESIRM